MIESLIKHYKGSIRTYSLVFTHIKLQYYLFWLTFIIFSACSFIFLLSLVKFGLNLNNMFFIAIPIAAVTGAFMWFNSSAKKVVARYDIHPKGFVWKTSEFEKLKMDLLIKYLTAQNVISEGKIKLLIEILNKESDRRKIPSLFAPGVFLAMFIPVWVQFTAITFKPITNVNIALAATIGLSGTALVVVISSGYIKTMMIGFSDLLINSEPQMIKELVRLLETLLLTIDKEKPSSLNNRFLVRSASSPHSGHIRLRRGEV